MKYFGFLCLILSMACANHQSRNPSSSPEQTGQCIEPISQVENYPLIKALLEGRSRRFFKGVEMPDGPLRFKSAKIAEPLTLEETALMAFAGSGITGYVSAELPYNSGPHGNGNVMNQVVGRSFASGDAAHVMAMIVINDDGAWLVRRPQDLTPDQTETVIQLGKDKKWVEAYKMLRIKITDHRPSIPQTPNISPTFNHWASNKPGTTYFLPLIDYSSLYLTVMFNLLDRHSGAHLVDERNSYESAGLKDFTKSKGGWLDDDLSHPYTFPVSSIETMVAQFASVEVGGALQNMRLMAQALGLGGFPHFSGAIGSWGESMKFDRVFVSTAKLAGKRSLIVKGAKAFNKSFDFPVEIGISRNNEPLFRTFTPANFQTAEEPAEATVKAFIEYKFGTKGHLRNDGHKTAWKNPLEIKSQIPKYDDELVKAVISHVKYMYDRYGRFPAGIGSLGHITSYQAHVLDTDFYDHYYTEGILSDTHRCRSK